jgi:hypothetical protein
MSGQHTASSRRHHDLVCPSTSRRDARSDESRIRTTALALKAFKIERHACYEGP